MAPSIRQIYKKQSRIHLFFISLWILMILPTLIWWKESILWVAFMSLYANIASHWSAYDASRAEEEINDKKK